MTLDEWRWNAAQFNRIEDRVKAAGVRFAYYNHTPEFRSENGVVFYDEWLHLTEPSKVTMELDLRLGGGSGKESSELPDAVSRAPFHFAGERLQDYGIGRALSAAALDRVGPGHDELSSDLRIGQGGQY
jgi:hypothetical protein